MRVTRFPGLGSAVLVQGYLFFSCQVLIARIPFLFACDAHVHTLAQFFVFVRQTVGFVFVFILVTVFLAVLFLANDRFEHFKGLAR